MQLLRGGQSVAEGFYSSKKRKACCPEEERQGKEGQRSATERGKKDDQGRIAKKYEDAIRESLS